MKGLYSHVWLQEFFEASLPSPNDVHEGLLKHAFEVEGVRKSENGDTVYEIDILSNRSADCLAHYGIAKELSAIFSLSLKRRYFTDMFAFRSNASYIHTDACDRYTILKVEDVSLSDTPSSIRTHLTSIGQQCVNPLTDLSNYLLFEIGQPIHVFDAAKVSGTFSVRQARPGERLVLLGGEEALLTEKEVVIVDAADDRVIALAGVKGGEEIKVDFDTSDVYVEIASFDDVSIRRTMRRLNLMTQAALRFSQGFPSGLIGYTAHRVAEVFGAYGSITASYDDCAQIILKRQPEVSLTVSGTNALLGADYVTEQVAGALDRFGFSYTYEGSSESFSVSIPPERPDLSDEHDLIEEVGRLLGYDTVSSTVPLPDSQANVGSSVRRGLLRGITGRVKDFLQTSLQQEDRDFKKHTAVLRALQGVGFSEIMTSSFCAKGDVCVAYPVAKDKGCLRTGLSRNMEEALERNAYNGELLGLGVIRLVEVGSVFTKEGECVHLVLGARETLGRSKVDYSIIEGQVREMLDISGGFEDGVWEVSLADVSVRSLTDDLFLSLGPMRYVSPSAYPFVLRDVAIFVPEGIRAEQAEKLLQKNGGEYLRRVNLFDTFEKDGKMSYAFRLVFQSDTGTLDDGVVNVQMDALYEGLRAAGYEVR